jgi:hypothetical protein
MSDNLIKQSESEQADQTDFMVEGTTAILRHNWELGWGGGREFLIW